MFRGAARIWAAIARAATYLGEAASRLAYGVRIIAILLVHLATTTPALVASAFARAAGRAPILAHAVILRAQFALFRLELWLAMIWEVVKYAWRWMMHKFVYLVAAFAMASSVFVLSFPFVFGASLLSENNGIDAMPVFPVFNRIAVAPVGWFFEHVEQALPRQCPPPAGKWGHPPARSCELHGADTKFSSIRLAAFDAILHAVFAVCVGIGVIFEASEVAQRELRRLRHQLTRASREAGDSMDGELFTFGSSYVDLMRSHRSFEWRMNWGMRITAWTSYLCFVVSALLSGVLLAVTPWHESLSIPVEQRSYFYAFVTAPFVSALALIIFVLMIVWGRFTYTGRILSRKRMIDLYQRQVQVELRARHRGG